MLAYRFRSVLVFTRALVISLLLGMWLAPAVQAQSGDAKSTALGIPTQVESSKTYTVSIKPDNSTTFTVQAQPRVSTSQAVEALPARQIPPPDDPDPPAPYNYANALGQSVPTQMVAGWSYTVSVTMYNSGTTTWSRAEDYTLMSYEPFNGWSWGPSRVPLPVDYVAPGQSVTFTFEVRAPETPGTHTFQWGMQRERYGSFGTTAPVVNVNVAPPTNNAQPAGQSAPTRMVAGWGYTVSVTMHNNGATTWSRALDYTLMSYAPMNGWVWGTSRVPLPSDGIAPGQTATFTFEVRAPETPGTYTFQWGMQREQYGAFGPPTEPLTINVVSPASSLGNVTFIHTDGLGSPVARTDGAGNLISRTYYEPYGNTAAGAQPTIGFTGHVNDVDTGLTYMQQRYYEPVASRMLSIDPITTDANTGNSFNRYSYGNNNPYSDLDPDGRDPIDWVHGGLTAASFCPSVCGSAFSAVDGLVSLAQGDRIGAGISFGSAAAGLVSDAGAAKVVALAAREVSSASKVESSVTKLFHYTDAAGAKGIEESGKILPNAKGQVFLTAEKLSPQAVKDTLFIGNSGTKGTHVVEVDLKNGAVVRAGKNENELIHQGTIRDGRQADLKVKVNE